MAHRITSFLYQDPGLSTSDGSGWTPRRVLKFVSNQIKVFRFYLIDVVPAIRARRQRPREDVISHLIASDYSGLEILTECLTYGTAGMVTTREFIAVTTWHMLTHPEYRQRFLAGDQEERYAMLHEFLRLEPVVQTLYRRALADLEVETPAGSVVIPAGSLVVLHVAAANIDESVVGSEPLAACPGRELADMRPKVPAYVLGFGDGNHRCPGAYVAIQETDIFLNRLLRLEGLRMVGEPEVGYNTTVEGYEVRGFTVSLA